MKGHVDARSGFNAAETVMKSTEHYHATLNYVQHNPVKHGYVRKWTDWSWSSAQSYLAALGEEEALRRWKLYTIDHYGSGWVDASL